MHSFFSVTGNPAPAYTTMTASNRHIIQQKNSEASWEITLTVSHHPTALCKRYALNTPHQRFYNILTICLIII